MTNDNRDQFEKQNTRYQRHVERSRRWDALLILALVAVAILAAAALLWSSGSWAKPEDVEVKLIGTAADGVEAGVICASFNAG